ncbi:O-antigen ligase family protein [Ventosimonas gracilis]|uniref:O-antigen ligase family protein n=1 Tax=Ventosimonas gracilis TaxID=1680762 RepID=UPI00128FAF20|nr:O-antigen ligase family protein [Ventosimonas gracilis]
MTQEIIPTVIGRGPEFFAFVTFLIFCVPLMVQVGRLKNNGLIITMMFLALLMYCSAWTGIYYALGEGFQQRTDVLYRSLSMIAGWFVLFSIGFFWPHRVPKAYLTLLATSFFGMACIVVFNMDSQEHIFQFGYSTKEGSYSYQGFALSAAFSLLVWLSTIKNIYRFFVVYASALVVIFFIGARSELVGFVVVFPFMVCLHYKRSPLKTIIASAVLIFFVAGGVVYAYENLAKSRQLQLLNITESSSGIARLDMQDKALDAIRRAPIMGDFAGDVRDYGNTGSYAHNLISAWRQFGILGFLLYTALLIFPLKVSRKLLKNNFHRDEFDLPIITYVFSIFSLTLILVSKTIFWPLPAFAWGLAVACCRKFDANI